MIFKQGIKVPIAIVEMNWLLFTGLCASMLPLRSVLSVCHWHTAPLHGLRPIKWRCRLGISAIA